MDNTLAIALTAAAVKLLSVWERRQLNARADRIRDLDKNDRAEKAAEAATALKREADRVAQATSEQTARVIEKLDANTQLTAETRADANSAYNAANDVNVKFLKIHQRLERVETRLDARKLA